MSFLDNWMDWTEGHANKPENQGNPSRGIFVIGTDTDVGKTYVASLLVGHLASLPVRVGVYKPVASGASLGVTSDAHRLIAASGQRWPIQRVCPQSFAAPLAPPVAAALEGRTVDEGLLATGLDWFRDRCDVVVIESAGGALSPLTSNSTVLDLAVRLSYPLVLVAAHRLGMINHILLTVEALERRGLRLLALIVSQVTVNANPEDDAAALAAACTPSGATHEVDQLKCSMGPADNAVRMEDSMSMIRSFCGDLPCFCVAHGGTALSRIAQ